MCLRYGGPHTIVRLSASRESGGYGLDGIALSLREKAIADPLFLASEVLGRTLLRKPCPEHRRAAQAIVDQKNLLLLLPRGHLKTTLVDEVGTIWQLLKYPNDRILFLQASEANAKALAGNIRAHMVRNPVFRSLFPEYAMEAADEGNVLSFSVPCRTAISREASVEIGTPGTSLAGRHYDIIAASDLMNEQTTPPPCGSGSAEMMQKIVDWYATIDGLLESRLVSPRAHKRIDGTRFHDADLYGYIIENDKEGRFEKVVNGVERGSDGRFIPVWDSFDADMLQEKYDSPTMTESLWAANYGNNPLPPDGATTFRKEWFTTYTDLPPREHFDVAITVDPAWTEEAKNKKSDRSAIVVSGVQHRTGHLYVLDAKAGRWTPNDLVEIVFSLVSFWNPSWVGFEQDDKGLKALFFNEMTRTGRYVNYRALKPGTKNKERRAAPLHNHAQHFHIFVRSPEHDELVGELLRFPVGKHDDYVDALAYRAFEMYHDGVQHLLEEPAPTWVPPEGQMTGKQFFERMKERKALKERPAWLRGVLRAS